MIKNPKFDKVYIVIHNINEETNIIAVFGSEQGARSFIDREFPAEHENRLYSIEEHEVYVM